MCASAPSRVLCTTRPRIMIAWYGLSGSIAEIPTRGFALHVAVFDSGPRPCDHDRIASTSTQTG